MKDELVIAEAELEHVYQRVAVAVHDEVLIALFTVVVVPFNQVHVFTHEPKRLVKVAVVDVWHRRYRLIQSDGEVVVRNLFVAPSTERLYALDEPLQDFIGLSCEARIAVLL